MVKPMDEYDRNEFCEECGAPAERQFTPRVHFIGASVEHAEYNPGLGAVVKNKRHRQELAKAKGMQEIGNDYKSPENMHKEFDKIRAERREKRWADE